jgi:hypothetical protein
MNILPNLLVISWFFYVFLGGDFVGYLLQDLTHLSEDLNF